MSRGDMIDGGDTFSVMKVSEGKRSTWEMAA